MSTTKRLSISLVFFCLSVSMILGGCNRPKATPTGRASNGTPESPSDVVLAGAGGSSNEQDDEPQAATKNSSNDMQSPNQQNPDAASASNASSAESPQTGSSPTPSGVFQPESVGIIAPQVGEEVAPEEPEPAIDRSFTDVPVLESEDPAILVAHLETIDTALKDLVVAGSNDLVPKDEFIQYGKKLGEAKLLTGQALANSPQSTNEQKKAGVLAQLIALSHMSGLGDVQSAKDLEALARGLVSSEDSDLAHQSRVVLLGFEIQALQNGQQEKPDNIMAQVNDLFGRPEDRNFPEFMIVQQAIVVMEQMGFKEDATKAKSILAAEYQSAADGQLRSSAWSLATQGSQALANYNQARASLQSADSDPQPLIAAARGLHEAFPTAQTLEEISRSLANIEYSGAVTASQLLAEFLRDKLQTAGENAASMATKTWLEDHDARLAMLGKKVDFLDAVDFDGKEFDWAEYEGKVVVVDFWASWCIPCLREIPKLREVYQQHSKDGLEIVGINMDDDLKNAESLLTSQKLPWKNYRFANALGFESAFAQRHGIKAIPFVLLIGKDGTVQKLHTRGEQLLPAVQAALGLEGSLIP
ncbi:MAG: TlpA disulfide reductase family protein [Planctomycetota bacterium]